MSTSTRLSLGKDLNRKKYQERYSKGNYNSNIDHLKTYYQPLNTEYKRYDSIIDKWNHTIHKLNSDPIQTQENYNQNASSYNQNSSSYVQNINHFQFLQDFNNFHRDYNENNPEYSIPKQFNTISFDSPKNMIQKPNQYLNNNTISHDERKNKYIDRNLKKFPKANETAPIEKMKSKRAPNSKKNELDEKRDGTEYFTHHPNSLLFQNRDELSFLDYEDSNFSFNHPSNYSSKDVSQIKKKKQAYSNDSVIKENKSTSFKINSTEFDRDLNIETNNYQNFQNKTLYKNYTNDNQNIINNSSSSKELNGNKEYIPDTENKLNHKEVNIGILENNNQESKEHSNNNKKISHLENINYENRIKPSNTNNTNNTNSNIIDQHLAYHSRHTSPTTNIKPIRNMTNHDLYNPIRRLHEIYYYPRNKSLQHNENFIFVERRIGNAIYYENLKKKLNFILPDYNTSLMNDVSKVVEKHSNSFVETIKEENLEHILQQFQLNNINSNDSNSDNEDKNNSKLEIAIKTIFEELDHLTQKYSNSNDNSNDNNFIDNESNLGNSNLKSFINNKTPYNEKDKSLNFSDEYHEENPPSPIQNEFRNVESQQSDIQISWIKDIKSYNLSENNNIESRSQIKNNENNTEDSINNFKENDKKNITKNQHTQQNQDSDNIYSDKASEIDELNEINQSIIQKEKTTSSFNKETNSKAILDLNDNLTAKQNQNEEINYEENDPNSLKNNLKKSLLIIQRYKSISSQQQSTIEEHEQIFKKKDETILNLKENVVKLKNDNNELESVANELNNEIEKINEENKIKENDLLNLIDKLNDDQKLLQNQNQALLSIKENYEEEINHLKKKISDINENRFSNQLDETTKLKNQLELLETLQSKQKQQELNYINKIEELTKSINILKTENENLNSTIENQKSKIESLSNHLENKLNNNTESQFNIEIQKLNQENAELKNKIENLESINISLENERKKVNELNDSIKKRDDEIESLKSKIEELDHIKIHNKQVIEDLKNKYELLHQEFKIIKQNQSQKNQNEEQNTVENNIKNQNEMLENQIEIDPIVDSQNEDEPPPYNSEEDNDIEYTDEDNFPIFRTEESSIIEPTEKQIFVLNELIDTERFYVDALNILIDHFGSALESLMDPDDFTYIFNNVESIYFTNRSFLDNLEVIYSRKAYKLIPRLFIQYSQIWKIYSNYILRYDEILVKLQKLKDLNPKYLEKESSIEKELKQSGNRTASLKSYSIMPVQRIPRYIMLLKDLKKKSPQEDFANELETAVEAIENLAKYCNDSKQKKSNKLKMVEIEEKLGLKNFSTIEDRKFEKEGTITIEDKPCKIYLFTDLLIIDQSPKKIHEIDFNDSLFSISEVPNKPNTFKIELSRLELYCTCITQVICQSWIQEVKKRIVSLLPGVEEIILYEGPLKKKGDTQSTLFRKRHHILTNYRMKYYSNGKMKGSYNIQNCKFGLHAKLAYGFTIQSVNRLYYLKAESEQELEAWFDALSKVPGSERVDAEKQCIACGKMKSKPNYSTLQWKKPNGKCKNCENI